MTLAEMDKSTAPVVTVKSPKTMKTKSTNTKRILIFGGGECVGLAKSLMKSRFNSQYGKYQVCSFVKPNAHADNILKTCKLYDIASDDIVILSVGQSDCNPFNIMSELCSTLKSLSCKVLLLKINHNDYLNEYKLNQMLKLVASQFPLCEYIDHNNYYKAKVSQYNMYELCNRINLVIDQIYYRSHILNTKKILQSRHVSKRLTNDNIVSMKRVEPRKGTIPFYFHSLNNPTEPRNNGNASIKHVEPKKGTIPFYFQNMAKNNRTSAKTTAPKADAPVSNAQEGTGVECFRTQ